MASLELWKPESRASSPLAYTEFENPSIGDAPFYSGSYVLQTKSPKASPRTLLRGSKATHTRGTHAHMSSCPHEAGASKGRSVLDVLFAVGFSVPPTLVAARSTSQSSKDEGTAVPAACRAVCPHGRSSVCCLLCAAQLNIANPSTGKQKLIEIEDEKKLCAALPWLLPCLQC